jgi:hypothetical protein
MSSKGDPQCGVAMMPGERYTRRRFARAILRLTATVLLVGRVAKTVAASSGGSSPFLPQFLAHAELQVETAAQRAELLRALQDSATLSPEELNLRRYADYQGKPHQWTALHVLRAYLYSPAFPPYPEADMFAELSSPGVCECLSLCAAKIAQIPGGI